MCPLFGSYWPLTFSNTEINLTFKFSFKSQFCESPISYYTTTQLLLKYLIYRISDSCNHYLPFFLHHHLDKIARHVSCLALPDQQPPNETDLRLQRDEYFCLLRDLDVQYRYPSGISHHRNPRIITLSLESTK